MYETVRDLVTYERAAGIDAVVVDLKGLMEVQPLSTIRPTGKPCRRCGNVDLEALKAPEGPTPWAEDRGIALAPPSWLESCDLIVSHSGMGNVGLGKDKPRIHVAHGRPHSSFLLGKLESNHVYRAYAEYAADPRWKAMITLWPGFGRYWELVFPRPVYEVQPFVDLARWVPVKSDYKFSGQSGKPNLVVADIWRHDRDPFHVLHAFADFAKGCPSARLHVYGLNKPDVDALEPILGGLRRRGVLGEIMGRKEDLLEVYNAADLMLTPHSIATRTIRESLACGLPVVAGRGCVYTPFRADDEDIDAYAAEIEGAWQIVSEHRDAVRATARGLAERYFQPGLAVQELMRIYEAALIG